MPSRVRLLSAVLVSYRSASLAAACVEGLRREAADAGVPLEVVVVDNSAEPEERSILGALPGVRYVPLGENAGYAGGLARGARVATGDVLLLANPDLVFARGSLPPLIRALELPKAGSVGPRFTWDEDGLWLLPPLWRPTPREEVAKVLARSRLRLRGPLVTAWHALALPQWEATEPVTVPGLVGALVVVPREVWERVGPYDEGFPLYFEDTDWSVRLAREGLSSFLVPASRVAHLGGQSTARASARSLASFLESERRYFAQHFTASARALRSAAGALFPPLPAGALPIARPPLGLEWRARGRVLVELTTLAEGAPAAGRFVDGSRFELGGSDWERIPAGPVFLRVTERASGRVVAEASFRKEDPVSPDGGSGPV